MLKNLTTEGRNPASESIDSLSPLEIARLMNAEDAKVAAAVGAEASAIAGAIERIAERLRAGGRLIYMGAGTSGRLGVLDATECPPTFNSPPEQVIGLIAGGPGALTHAVEGAEDRPELGVEALKQVQLTARDTVVGIATSGRTPYVIGGLAYARQLGALTVAVSCNAQSEIAAAAELAIVPIVGPEVLSGSTRLKAGTATKLVLNMLTTGAMVRIGKTYGNLMVDLRATNSKLRDRARRIVTALTDLDEQGAQRLLDRAGGELKTAVVLHYLDKRNGAAADATEARRRLAEAEGHLRTALLRCGNEPKRDEPPPADAIGEPLVLGIDGGGTSTVALLARVVNGQPRVIGRGEAGPANPRVVGFERSCETLMLAVQRAFAAALTEPGSVVTAVLALAGAGREEERRRLEQWAQASRLAERFEQVNDALPLLAAGTPHGWGIALVAGTGSLAFGKHANGQTARAGGWGYLFGDEGSAYKIALAGLRAVAAADDRRAPSTLLGERLLAALNVREPQQLVQAVYGAPLDRATLASLAPLVTAAADEGDAVAGQIIEQAAGDLADMVAAVARQLDMAQDLFPLAMAGGVLTQSKLVRERVIVQLSERHQMHPAEVSLVDEPVLGTLRLASQLACS
jgi:N-acetylmuramic acid 6-phosphate etherase